MFSYSSSAAVSRGRGRGASAGPDFWGRETENLSKTWMEKMPYRGEPKGKKKKHEKTGHWGFGSPAVVAERETMGCQIK